MEVSSKRINLETKRIPMKACSTKKKSLLTSKTICFKGPADEASKGTCDSSLLDQNMEMKPVKHPDVREVPLTQEDQKSWLDFKKLDKGRPAIKRIYYRREGIWPLERDHPFVSVIGDFAITAFNKIIEAFVKKDNSNNLRFAEIMDCTYVTVKRSPLAYFFIMDIEAIEEGILGVYRTIVACYARSGRRTLVSFYLTDRKPTGKIAMKMSRLICLKSRYKNMKAVKKDLKIKLERTHKSFQGKKKTGKVAEELIRLETQYKDIKGICKMLYRHIRLQTPKAWKERSNPDAWSNPGLHTKELRDRRAIGNETSRKGYNYFTNFKNFGPYYGRVPAFPLY